MHAGADPGAPAGADPYPAVERFIRALEMVHANYPDAAKVDYDRLVNRALEGMLGSLDPHSSFIHPETQAETGDGQLDPHLGTLGISLGRRADGLYLAAIDDSSPASQAELRAGDQLLEVDGKEVGMLALRDALGLLAGAPGEPVSLKIQRPHERDTRSARLVRVAVREHSVAEARMLDNSKTGFVYLSEFTAGAPQELEQALDTLEDAGMNALILDLRGNPGGLLTAAVEILGLFLPPDTEVVTTRGRHPEASQPPLKTPARQRRKRDYPLRVLVDGHSASASELVAAALQDLKRAKVYGEKTYGKGSVQNIIPMGKGTALRLTIATYHTPSGRTPHLVGVLPDVAVATTPADRAKLEIFRRRAAATPAEREQLAGWSDPVVASAAADR